MQWPGGADRIGSLRRSRERDNALCGSARRHSASGARSATGGLSHRRLAPSRGSLRPRSRRSRASRAPIAPVDAVVAAASTGVGTLALRPPAQDDVARKQAFVLAPLPIGLQRVRRRCALRFLIDRNHVALARRRSLGFTERLCLQRTQSFLIVAHTVGARCLRGCRRRHVSRWRVRPTHQQHDREHPDRNPGHDPGLHAPGQDTPRNGTMVGDSGRTRRRGGVVAVTGGVSAISHLPLRKGEALLPERQVALRPEPSARRTCPAAPESSRSDGLPSFTSYSAGSSLASALM